jgi:hypothetical protein
MQKILCKFFILIPILSIVLFVLSFIFPLKTKAFSGGDGSIENPYKLYSCEDIIEINSGDGINLDFNYELENDLDCRAFGNSIMIGKYINNPISQNFSPSTESKAFSGSFNGKFHYVIVNINNTTLDQGVGLFSYIKTSGSRSVISNLIVKGYVKGYKRVGGIAGVAMWNDFTRVANQAEIHSSHLGSGGIVGSGRLVHLSNCLNAGDIYTLGYGGGIGGDIEEGSTIIDCINQGKIYTEHSPTGGIAGSINASMVRRCYSSGNIIGSGAVVGGLVGMVEVYAGSALPRVVDSFSATQLPNIIGNNGLLGLVDPFVLEMNMVKNNYWDVYRSNVSKCADTVPDVGDIIGPGVCEQVNVLGTDSNYFFNNTTNKPFTDEFGNQLWDFVNIWESVENGYPRLRVFSEEILSITPPVIPLVTITPIISPSITPTITSPKPSPLITPFTNEESQDVIGINYSIRLNEEEDQEESKTTVIPTNSYFNNKISDLPNTGEGEALQESNLFIWGLALLGLVLVGFIIFLFYKLILLKILNNHGKI